MKLHLSRHSIEKQKKRYLVFISIILLFIVLGFFFYFIISDSNKELVSKTQMDFFNSIFNNNINYLSSFINSFISNFIYVFLIFILGYSLIGFVFVLLIIIFKSFVLGFSISSIIGTYGLKGILLSLLYVFPHQILYLVCILLISYYSCSFCFKLYRYIFKKSIINFKKLKERYIKIFLICLFVSLLCSLYEVFIMSKLIVMLV